MLPNGFCKRFVRSGRCLGLFRVTKINFLGIDFEASSDVVINYVRCSQ